MRKNSVPAAPRYYVLAVQDDRAGLEWLRGVLEHGGCHVTTCTTADAAVAACAKAARAYDAVLLDGLSPGIAVLERLRRTTGGARAPIVCVFPRGEEASRKEALARGCAMGLTRPMSDRELLGAVERLGASRLAESAG